MIPLADTAVYPWGAVFFSSHLIADLFEKVIEREREREKVIMGYVTMIFSWI